MRPSNITTVLFWIFITAVCVSAQTPKPEATPAPGTSGISLAPARLELEMQPGTETTRRNKSRLSQQRGKLATGTHSRQLE